MTYYHNRCRFDKIERDMHGVHYAGCVHPDRPKLSGKLSNFLHKLFGTKYYCAAKPGFQQYCPYYLSDTEEISVDKLIKKHIENMNAKPCTGEEGLADVSD